MTRLPYDVNRQYRESACKWDMKNARLCGGGSTGIPSESPLRRSKRPSAVVVCVPSRSVWKSTRSPSTRTVSGMPANGVVRWSCPLASEGARRGAFPPEIQGFRRTPPTRCGNERARSIRRWSRARDAAVAPPGGRAAWSRAGEPDSENAKGATPGRAWLPAKSVRITTARAAPILVRTDTVAEVLEVVTDRETVHASQELRLRHGSVIDPNPAIVQPESERPVLDRAARIADVSRAKGDQAVEFVLEAGVPDVDGERASRKQEARRVGGEEHPVHVGLDGGGCRAEADVPPEGGGLGLVDVRDVRADV